MKKAAIVTIWDLWNLGNRLQNYAVISIANKKGLLPVTAVREAPPKEGIYEWIKLWVYSGIFYITRGHHKKSRSWLRVKQFKDFTRLHIPSECIMSVDQLNGYDYVLIGSDQIWNAEVVEPDEFVYGQVNDSNKIICVSPSFGVTGFNANQERAIASYLKRIHYLSTREHTGADIIERLTGEIAPVFLDPTLMLTMQEWEKIEKKPRRLPHKNYILKYFLGEESEDSKKETDELCQKYGFEVVQLLDKNNPWAYITGPAEFLYLIHHAEMILTDSFHACVFSILFRRPFWVYNRTGERMNSRLDTLFELLQIDNRFVHNMEKPFAVDFSSVDEKLEIERKRFNKFFDAAIRGIEVTNNEI